MPNSIISIDEKKESTVARDQSNPSEIFNGARCQTYSWSQSHSDLEIRAKLPKGKTQEIKIKIKLKKGEILVKVYVCNGFECFHPVLGRFEHEVDVESAYWMVDKESSSLVIYLDKTEDMWWNKLLVHEQPTELGPKNYTVPMDELDEGARMAVDKLITDQKKKLISSRDDKLSPA